MSGQFRWGIVAAICLCEILQYSDGAWAQNPAATKPKRKSEERTLTTNDGAEIHLTYYPSQASPAKESAVVILLHGAKGSRQIWKKMAETLQDNDYAVVAPDLRGHGESSGGPSSNNKMTGPLLPKHYGAMVTEDLEAVKQFIFDEHQKEKLNMNKLAIFAADDSTVIAVNFAELDWLKTPYDDATDPTLRTPRGQDVRSLVLFSPVKSLGAINTGNALKALRSIGVPIITFVGENDKNDKGNFKAFEDALLPKETSKKDDHLQFYKLAKIADRGTNLLNNNNVRIEFKTENKTEVKSLEYVTLYFLEKHLKRANSSWRDRRSPLFSDKK